MKQFEELVQVSYSLENRDYLALRGDRVNQPKHVILPYESNLLKSAEDRYKKGTQDELDTSELVKLRIVNVAKYLGAVCVKYPEINEDRVTLGSRVELVEDNDLITFDIVGFEKLYKDDRLNNDGEEIVVLPVSSPLATTILGHKVGENLSLKIDRISTPIEIISIDQSALEAEGLSNFVDLQITD